MCGLMKYLIWYNTEKPHQGINLQTPMQYFLEGLGLTPGKSSMLRYRTLIDNICAVCYTTYEQMFTYSMYGDKKEGPRNL